MTIFTFDESHSLGKVRTVDAHRVTVHAGSDEDLRKARIGQLVALSLPGPLDEWVIGIILKVTKTPVWGEYISAEEMEEDEMPAEELPHESTLNAVLLTLVGMVGLSTNNKPEFSRSLIQAPDIDSQCYILRDDQLQKFMNLLSTEGSTENSLKIGHYTIDKNTDAYLDGNKLFQRHASLLGSTGSGKSWSVASILEQAAKLTSANLVVFDLHGEYRNLSYARHLRIPGPEELEDIQDTLLFLPYWLLNAEELQAVFIDRTEQGAHNQVSKFQEIVIGQKEQRLQELGKDDVLESLTLDSPVPFDVNAVLGELGRLNTEMVPGTGTRERQGPFYGQFSRLIPRLRSKISDKRYAFLFQAPDSENDYGSMARTAKNLMSYLAENTRVKVINFSEVPSDILPVVMGLVARLIYQIQFWTEQSSRHPIALVCDEAHLYLPKKEDRNPLEQRAVENFEKIAKEGRKYGIALLVVSQRPSDVSSTILSQCNNIIALRLANGDDQSTVRRLMPETIEGLMDMLPILDIGEALVVGDAVLLPSRIRINPPEEKPISATIDFWDEWKQKVQEPDFVKVIENMRRQSRK